MPHYKLISWHVIKTILLFFLQDPEFLVPDHTKRSRQHEAIWELQIMFDDVEDNAIDPENEENEWFQY